MKPNWIIMPYIDAPDFTRPAIGDCVQQSIHPSVLLIDNGSQDPTIGIEAALHFSQAPLMVWRHAPALPSLAATWNRALQFVWDSGGQYALVVNNDVRLWPHTYDELRNVQEMTGAWFVSAVGVTEPQFEEFVDVVGQHPDMLMRIHRSRGGPDFSCFLITKECHRWFQFDEGFQPAYHEDNDYHRRLQLAGLGDRIFGVNLPFLHWGSGTLKSNPRMEQSWGPRFQACQQYYIRKWGGLPGSETYPIPFNPRETPEMVRQVGGDLRDYYTGQSTPGHWGKGPYPWDAASTS